MNLDWYVFEESYLLDINYEISKCSLSIKIDAKKSISHPEVTKIESYESSFETLEINFKDVVYYTGISSLNILKDPNDDIGGIHQLSIGILTTEDGIRIGNDEKLYEVSLNKNNQVIAELYMRLTNLKIIEFFSEMISFKAGFESYTMNKIYLD